MRKMSTTIGKALTSAYILYSCRDEPKSGYRLLLEGKEMLLANWSPGSFYPVVNMLLKNGMLVRTREGGKRVAYAYRATKEGVAYLKQVSGYFQERKLREFFSYLMKG